VSNVLGTGFLEKLYERALIEELRLRGIPVAAQATFPVAYKGKHIGTYAADLIVDGPSARRSQMRRPAEQRAPGAVHQLPEGSGLHLALLINFCKSRVAWRRVVHDL
jgi:GxxExxY protein